MSIFMVSRVEDKSRNIVGIGLLDVGNKKFKVVPSNQVINAINVGKISIENLEVVNNKIKGFNGSIERYPLINQSGDIVSGENTITILNELISDDKTIGYQISDFKGQIRSVKYDSLIKYAKIHGISNGKVVNKEGTEFISAIEGNYTKQEVEVKKTEANRERQRRSNRQSRSKSELYTGDVVTTIPKLKPILVGEPILGRERPEYTIISDGIKDLKRGQVSLDKLYMVDIARCDIHKGVMYSSEDYTLCGEIYRKLYNKHYNRVTEDVYNAMRIEELRMGFEEYRRASMRNDYLNSIGDNLEVYPTRKGITIFLISEFLDTNNPLYQDVEDAEIKKYSRYLNSDRRIVYSGINFGNKKVAMVRSCNSKGIQYKVLEFSGENIIFNKTKAGNEYYYYEITDKTLEEIYEDRYDYNNVIESGNYITIVGLDDVIRYDMELIEEEYNRLIVKSTKGLKAKTLGYDYNEILHNNGDLKELRSDLETLNIPEGAKNILKNAIIIGKENTRIVFGSNVEKCSSMCFESHKAYGDDLCIEIGCNENAGLNIIKSYGRVKANGRLQRDTTLQFTRDITPIEYVNAIYCNVSKIEGPLNIDDDFISEAIQYTIEDKLKELSPLKITDEEVQFKYLYRTKYNKTFKEFVRNTDKLKRIWENSLVDYASDTLRIYMNNVIKEIEKRIEDRPKEIERLIREKNTKPI